MMTRARPGRWALLALAVSCATAVAQDEPDPRPTEGRAMPAFTLTDAGGKEVRSEQLFQRPLLLIVLNREQNLSQRFLRELAPVLEEFPDPAALTVALVFPGAEREGTNVAMARELKAPARTLWDPERALTRALGLLAFPTCFLVDREGAITHVWRGYELSMVGEMVDALKIATGLVTAEQLAARRAHHEEADPKDRARRRWLSLGRSCLEDGRPAEALAAFEQVLADTPADARALAGQAVALDALGRPEAFEALQAAHRAVADDRDVAVRLAERLIERGALAEGEQLLREAVVDNPRPERAYLLLGDVLSRAERWREAAEAYREAARGARR